MKKKIRYAHLLKFVKEILFKVNLDRFSIDSVATGLCETTLRGVDSHGVRLLPHYVRSALMGRKNPRPSFKFKKTFPAIGVLDADNGFGHAAGLKAIEHCIKLAKKNGIGVVAVKNSSHPGAMATMALKAARKGYISFAFTHADSLLLSHNGTRPYFGTNPICVAVPRVEKEPYCLDMATSMISWNKLLTFKEQGKLLSRGLAANKKGQPTINPNLAKSLIGAGSYKGYGLASVVEILCGIYTGMAFGRSIPRMYNSPIRKPRKLGQFYIVLRIDGCINRINFFKRMQSLSNQVRNEPKRSKQKVMLPNDIEIKKTKDQLKNGVVLSDEVFKKFMQLSKKYSIKLNLINQ